MQRITWIGLALALLPACSSGPAPAPEPVPIADYRAPAAYAPGPYASASQGPPTPAAPAHGVFRWHSRLADAQAEAQSTGRMILVATTKPNCGLCEKFRHEVVPAVQARVAAVSVGFLYDIRPEARPADCAGLDRTLRENLRGASLMPLVGFFSPQLHWIHGFWGATSAGEFNAVIAEATRRHPVRVAQVPATQVPGARTAVINEYGEPEWSPLADVWPGGLPQPLDALPGTPQWQPAAPGPAPAGLTTMPQPLLASGAAVPAPLPPLPAPPALPLTSQGAPLPVSLPAPSAPAAPGTTPTPPPAATASPGTHTTWSEPAATDTDPSAGPSGAKWAEQTLREALQQIRSGRYEEARELLAEVQARAPNSPHARDAAKGSVAIYNAKRIEQASDEAERTLVLERARRDLGNSIWGELFA